MKHMVMILKSVMRITKIFEMIINIQLHVY
jgi:hypothetical protein